MSPTIYHGTPLTPRAALLDVLAGRAACVSFYRPDDVEAVEAVCPQLMFRQRRLFILDAGDALGPGVGRGSRLDALLSLAGRAAVHARPLGGCTRQSRRSVADQRRAAQRLAVRAEGSAAVAHGWSAGTAWPASGEVGSRLPRLDRRPEERAGRLPCLPSPDGGSRYLSRQPLAGAAHDARHSGGAGLPVRLGRRDQPRAERASL